MLYIVKRTSSWCVVKKIEYRWKWYGMKNNDMYGFVNDGYDVVIGCSRRRFYLLNNNFVGVFKQDTYGHNLGEEYDFFAVKKDAGIAACGIQIISF